MWSSTGHCAFCCSLSWIREQASRDPTHLWPWRTSRKSSTVSAAISSAPSQQSIQARISVAASTGRLDLSSCGLEEVPEQVFSLKNLVDLSIAGNRLTYIQDDIKNLTNLKRLGLSGNWLSELPPSIGKLKHLEGLWIQGNVLQSIPKEISNLSMLSVLALTGNVISEIPETIGSLSCLQVLSLSGNKIQQLPSDLGNLTALKVLALNGNFLQSLPANTNMLSSLEELALQGNQIKYLPVDLNGLNSLKGLSAADNDLSDLPKSIGELHHLKSLSLYGNKIEQLPNDLSRLKELRRLWLEGNPIRRAFELSFLPPNLSSLGVDLHMEIPSTVQAGLGHVIQSSKITGTGLASYLGGYFKLQFEQSVEPATSQADTVVVAFGSAPGVPNWGGLLRRVKAALVADGNLSTFDVLYVVDSRRSWYTENKLGENGKISYYEEAEELNFEINAGDGDSDFGELNLYYEQELQEALKEYRHVIMLGDSMGASAALMFSPFATAVIAFCPQVDLAVSAIRPGRGIDWFNAFKMELLDSVIASSAKITVHCGSWEHDLHQAKLLPDKVELVVHHSDSHRLAKQLDIEGSLISIVRKKIEEEMPILDRA